jgi:CBS domain-containing protein
MNLSECMTEGVVVIKPEDTIAVAASVMADTEAGMLLVGEEDRLVGVVTDRDLVVRGLGAGKDADTPVRDVMSDGVKYCFEDEELSHVADNMAAIQVRRLAVLNRSKKLVGVVSLGDIARRGDNEIVGGMLRDISQPATSHAT